MTKRVKIAPSILSADFGRLAEEIGALERAGADWLHVDVMDGHFVPNLTIGPDVVAAIRRATGLPLDIHLMIEEPDRYVERFIEAGGDMVTVHVETVPHLHRTIEHIRSLGAKPGVVLNPATSLNFLDYILEDVDLVLLMSVNPGFGGQGFIPGVVSKIAALRQRIQGRGLSVDIEVDGGIKIDNCAAVVRAGATVVVSGSGILNTSDYRATIEGMQEEIRKAGALGGLDEKGRLSAF